MLVPTGHRVLVRMDEPETETESGIVIVTDERLERAGIQRGHILAIGDLAWKAFSKNYDGKPWAKVGDYILISKFAGKWVEDPETKEILSIINDEDVIAVIKESGAEENVDETKEVA